MMSFKIVMHYGANSTDRQHLTRRIYESVIRFSGSTSDFCKLNPFLPRTINSKNECKLFCVAVRTFITHAHRERGFTLGPFFSSQSPASSTSISTWSSKATCAISPCPKQMTAQHIRWSECLESSCRANLSRQSEPLLSQRYVRSRINNRVSRIRSDKSDKLICFSFGIESST